MNAARRHPAPPELEKRGMAEAVEVTPTAGGFRVRNAGHRISVLFREELLQRQALRANTKREASRA